MSKRRGYTLVELMVVIGIITALFAFGVASIMRFSSGNAFYAEASAVKSMLRKARNYCRTMRAPAVVYVDPVSNTIYSTGLQSVGTWHFEDGAGGAQGIATAKGERGIDAAIHNANFVRGYVREGLEFGTDPNLKGYESYLSVSDSKLPDMPAGVLVSLWFYPGDFWSAKFQQAFNVTNLPNYEGLKDDDEVARERARLTENEKYRRWLKTKRFDLVTKGDSFYIHLDGAYAVIVGFNSYYYVKTPDGVARPNAWNHLEVSYDGESPRVVVNDVPYTLGDISSHYGLRFVMNGEEISFDEARENIRREAFPKKLQKNDAPLFISGPVDSFYGKIDEVRLFRYVTPDVYRLDRAQLEGYRRRIYFSPEGKLDGSRHSTAALVVLTDDTDYRPPEAEDPEAIKNARTGLRDFVDADEVLARERDAVMEQSSSKSVRRQTITVDLNGSIR